MYEELIKNLRNCSEVNSLSRYKRDLMKQAADAIEKLQRSKCPHYIRNVHDRGDDSLCRKWKCEVKSLPKWIPVTERLPEESGSYLIYVVGGEFKQWSMVTMAYYHKIFYYDDREDNFDQITYWMPLPQPPEDK